MVRIGGQGGCDGDGHGTDSCRWMLEEEAWMLKGKVDVMIVEDCLSSKYGPNLLSMSIHIVIHGLNAEFVVAYILWPEAGLEDAVP